MKQEFATREFAALTSRGLRRKTNEDAMAVAGELIFGEAANPVTGFVPPGRAAAFVVSDGVGGNVHGARASREVASDFLDDAQDLLIEQRCIEAVLRANLRLNQVMLDNPETVGMAATIAGIAVRDDTICWFNVGDSRIYRKTPTNLIQMSVDDTGPVVGHRSHTLQRSLGGQRSIVPTLPHFGQSAVSADNRYLLCSDGLWGMLSDTTIANILDQEPAAESAVRMLLSATLDAGGLDNVSIVLIQPTSAVNPS